MDPAKLYILSGLGFAVTETLLPTLERDIDYGSHIYIGNAYRTVTEDTLPEVERDYQARFQGFASALDSTQSLKARCPSRSVRYPTMPRSTQEMRCRALMETPIGDVIEQPLHPRKRSA